MDWAKIFISFLTLSSGKYVKVMWIKLVFFSGEGEWKSNKSNIVSIENIVAMLNK